MRVHEAAGALGVTPRALRFYEEKGLIAPAKESHNGYRAYSPRDLVRLRWIVALRELSMPIAAIRQCLDSVDNPAQFVRKLDHARSELYAELTDIAGALSMLDETMEAWRREGLPRLEEAEQAAARLKHRRALRSSWSDPLDYDALALRYGEHAPLIAHAGLVGPGQYERVLHRTVEWLDPREGEAGIELGAGSGNLSVLLHAAGTRLTLVEQSAEMLALLRERLPQADTRAGNLLALPIGAKQYHFAACTFALHHLTRPQQLLALAEMDRVLLPGGRFVIAGMMLDEQVSVPDAAADGKTVKAPLSFGPDQAPSSLSDQAAEASKRTAGPQTSSAAPTSPADRAGALVPSSPAELSAWLRAKGYSCIGERVGERIALLYAVKS